MSSKIKNASLASALAASLIFNGSLAWADDAGAPLGSTAASSAACAKTQYHLAKGKVWVQFMVDEYDEFSLAIDDNTKILKNKRAAWIPRFMTFDVPNEGAFQKRSDAYKASAWDFLGKQGETFFHLDTTSRKEGELRPALSSSFIKKGTLKDDRFEVSFKKTVGDGEVKIYQVNRDLAPHVLFDSADESKQKAILPAQSLVDVNWIFTKPGTYSIEVLPTGVSAGGEAIEATEPITLHFVVGDEAIKQCPAHPESQLPYADMGAEDVFPGEMETGESEPPAGDNGSTGGDAEDPGTSDGPGKPGDKSEDEPGDKPGENDDAPGEGGDTPGADDDAPGKDDETPGGGEETPGKDNETPGKEGPNPGSDDPSNPDTGEKPAPGHLTIDELVLKLNGGKNPVAPRPLKKPGVTTVKDLVPAVSPVLDLTNPSNTAVPGSTGVQASVGTPIPSTVVSAADMAPAVATVSTATQLPAGAADAPALALASEATPAADGAAAEGAQAEGTAEEGAATDEAASDGNGKVRKLSAAKGTRAAEAPLAAAPESAAPSMWQGFILGIGVASFVGGALFYASARRKVKAAE